MKNTTKSYKDIFAEKKAMMDVLEDVLADIEYRETALLRDYKEVGEEQRKDNDGNLLYLDSDGNRTTDVTDTPCMRTVYDDVQRDPSELDERDRAKYDAIQKVKDAVLALA